MRYKIVTRSICLTEYVIEADNGKDAEQLFNDGEYISEKITDYQDETILSTKQKLGPDK